MIRFSSFSVSGQAFFSAIKLLGNFELFSRFVRDGCSLTCTQIDISVPNALIDYLERVHWEAIEKLIFSYNHWERKSRPASIIRTVLHIKLAAFPDALLLCRFRESLCCNSLPFFLCFILLWNLSWTYFVQLTFGLDLNTFLLIWGYLFAWVVNKLTLWKLRLFSVCSHFMVDTRIFLQGIGFYKVLPYLCLIEKSWPKHASAILRADF